MNKIELLPRAIKVNDNYYEPSLYLTAWGKWCISYRNVVDKKDYICSVTVEPEHEPIKIEDTIGCINEYIGNTKNIDDAIDMIATYLKNKGYSDIYYD